MSIISKQDTNGVKPLLLTGELGYDNYAAGGDRGRVFVGTGTENIGLAKKTEVVAVDGKADAHIARVDNPHSVTKAQVGLGNADNTADVDKKVLSATKLTTPRNITISGEVAGSASFDGSTNINISTTIQPNSVALGTDTTGNYVSSVVAGAGITVTGAAGEGWSPTVAISPVGTVGTYTKVTTNDKGQVVTGTILAASDIPSLDASKITSGIIDAARLPAYVDDVLEYAALSVFPTTGETGKIYVALDTNKAYRWSGSTYVYITSGAVDSVAGKTGVVTLVKADVGLANVDNTSDIDKPISTATQTALNTKVDTTTNQTIAGTKTFSVNPVSTATQNTAVNALTRKDYVDGLNTSNVKLTGNQTIAGVKTFSSTIAGSINGNSATATKLETARTINGVSFDGSANIVAPTNLTVGTRTTTVVPIESSSGTNASIPAATTALAGVMSSADKVKLDGIAAGAQVNVATNLGITAGTTAGPIVTSSTGTNATLPTASATASGVVTTGAQTWAGVKTFNSSPIVPTPKADFQATTARSTNITVNVGAGQTYTTINQALEYLSGFYPLYKQSGITATINLKAGFVMNEQVLVRGLNLGWITIVGEDAETIINHTALTTDFHWGYPAFGVDKGGASPAIGQLFRFNVERVGGEKYGIMTVGAGSSAVVLYNKGFIGAGTYGIIAYAGSIINANGANASNAGANGIFATSGSLINANGAIIQNQTTGTARVLVANGAQIAAINIDTTGGTVPAFSQAANTLTANGIIYG